MRRLWNHQLAALDYTREHDNPALFPKMRTGKTLVVLRRIQERIEQQGRSAGYRCLVVAPSTALDTWVNELHMEREKDITLLSGTRPQRLSLLKEGHRWNLTNWESYRCIPELADILWDEVILDESSYFLRNPKSKVTKFYLQNFRDSRHRWILTGTPNPENDLDFWTQLAFLDGNAFGCKSYYEFRYKFFQQPTMDYRWQPKIGGMTAIKKYLARRVLIMGREVFKGEDVKKVFEPRYFTLPSEVQQVYDTAEQEFLLEYKDKILKSSKFSIVKYSWLRQLCAGFIEKKLVWTEKLKELVRILQGELAQEQVVIWTNFKRELRQVYHYLTDHGISAITISGNTKRLSKRFKRLKEFRANQYRVLICQSALGSSSLDLSCANSCIYMSPPLSGLTWDQSQDRIIHLDKIGKSPLLIIPLLVKDSIETDVYSGLQDKLLSSCNLLQRVNQMILERGKTRRGSHGKSKVSGRYN